MMRLINSLPRAVWIAAGLTALLALVVGLDVTPWVRGGYGWRWPYDPAALTRAIPLIIGVIIYVAGAYALLGRTRRAGPVLAWAMLAAVVLPVLVVLLRYDNVTQELFERTASGLTTGPHRAGSEIGWGGAEWTNWPEFVHRPEWTGGHVAVAPPGLPLWYAFLSALFDRVPFISDPLHRALLQYQCHNYALLNDTPGEWASAWFGVLMPLWSALAVLPMYGVARHLRGVRPLAREVALWFPLIPSLAIFSPTWSTVYPVLILSIFWLLALGIERRSSARLVASGALMGLGLFMNYTFVPLLGIMGFYTLYHYFLVERHRLNPPGLLRPVLVGAWFGAGLLIPWLLYFIWSGETPLDLFRASLDVHLEIDRPYVPWVFIHYWDWTFWNGFALMVMWYAGLLAWARQRAGEIPVLPLALLSTVVFLAISGTARGEAGRVWLPFTPFMLLAAADGLNRILRGRRVRESWAVLTAMHALMLLVMAVSLNVIESGFSQTPPPPQAMGDLRAADYAFSAGDDGGRFRLTGWDTTVDNDTLTLNLRWQGERRATSPYWFSALLVGPDGAVIAASDLAQPGGAGADRFPTTCWARGMVVGDSIRIPLPDNTSLDDAAVSLAAYGDSTHPDGRLTVTAPDGARDIQAGLYPLRGE